MLFEPCAPRLGIGEHERSPLIFIGILGGILGPCTRRRLPRTTLDGRTTVRGTIDPMTTEAASLTARLRSSRVRRRDVLIGGAVGAALVLAPPIRARATMPAGLGSAIQELMAAGRLPGLSAAVVRGGEVVWSHAWGMANIAAGRRARHRHAVHARERLEDRGRHRRAPGDRGRTVRAGHPRERRAPVPRPQSRSPGAADHRPPAPHAHVEHPRQLDAAERQLRGRRRRDGAADVPPSVPGAGRRRPRAEQLLRVRPRPFLPVRERRCRRRGVPRGGRRRHRLRHVVRAADLRAARHGSRRVAPGRTSSP